MTCRLRVIAGPSAGLEVTLPAVGVVVGAEPGCDVVLEDRAVSKRHASIAPVPGGFEVTDLGSRNGTWLDGAALTRAVVPAGTTIRAGASVLQLFPAEEVALVEPSARRSFGEMVGDGPPIRTAFAMLERACTTGVPILVTGESGTGKELAARAVHDESPRRGGPFVVFDCGAASESLVESELFGHKRGAFTGAHEDRPGAFALADRGTLFLDEIGDLPLPLQTKLLRLVERGEVTPLGGRRVERYDVRIVAATHRDLWAEVASGAFRGDLYYRLAVVEVHLPPLRARREDIPLLCERFLAAHGARTEVGGPSLARLLDYGWPGNVRELRNVIARAVALAPPGASFEQMPLMLRPGSLVAPEPLARADVGYHEAKDALLARFEREYFTDLLRRAGGNLSHAARIAGLERKFLYRLLERAGVPRPRDADG